MDDTGRRPDAGNWTATARALALAGALLATACVMPEGGATGGAGGGPSKAVTTSVRVAEGAVTLAAPQGYCADTAESRDGPWGAFVLFGSCASLAGSKSAASPRHPAILTASTRPTKATSAEFASSFGPMAQYLASDQGRAALSRSGRAATVTIRQIVAAGDVLYIRAADTAEASGREVEAEYWRALFSVDGQIVTLSVLGLAAKPMSADDKRALLDRFVAKVKAANG